jgi:hypothetical protein
MWRHQRDSDIEIGHEADIAYQAFLHQAQGADALHLYNLSRIDVSTNNNQQHSDFQFPWNIDDHGRESISQPAEPSSKQGLLRRVSPTNDTTPYHEIHLDGHGHGSDFEYRSCGQHRCSLYSGSLLFLALGFGVLSAVYASGSATKMLNLRLFSSSPSNSLFALRVLSEISTILSWGLGLAALEELQWSLASRPKGVGLMNFVSLDLGTGLWGLLRLIWRGHWKSKVTAIVRYAARKAWIVPFSN